MLDLFPKGSQTITINSKQQMSKSKETTELWMWHSGETTLTPWVF